MGFITDDNGPNCNMPNADNLFTCSDVQAAVGGANQLIALGMSCYSPNGPAWQQTARSMHVGGVFTCFCDGSVHWISDFVQLGTGPNNLGVWDKLNLSNDGLPTDVSKF